MSVRFVVGGFILLLTFGPTMVGCAERGAAAQGEGGAAAGIDCGEHGSAHGDHCHCHQGYLFDGETCVAPGDITEVCGEHAQEHQHGACVCPDEGPCPCDHGTIVTFEGQDYCEPELH